MVRSSLSVEIENKKQFERIVRKLPKAAEEVSKDIISYMLILGQRRARKHAPVYTHRLKQLMRYTRKRDRLGGAVFSPVRYQDYVHQGHIPVPTAFIGAESKRDLKLWVNKKLGLSGNHAYLVARKIGKNLREQGVRKPTPFLRMAAKDISRKRIVDKVASEAMQRFIRKQL